MNYTPVTTYYYLDKQPVRIFFTDNKLYFIAHDICVITGLSITNIDDKYKDLKKVLTATGQKELFVFNVCQLFQVLEKYKRFENVSLAGWIRFTIIDSQIKSVMMPAVIEQPTLFDESQEKDNKAIQRDVMTVKQVAEVLGVTPEAIKKHIRELFPEIIKNGVETQLNEIQVTKIKNKMIPTTRVVGSKTRLEKALIVQQALLIQQEEISELRTENTELKKENAKLIPKAIAHDKYLAGENAEDMATVAQKLYNGRVGRNRLFHELREAGILKQDNIPYQQYAHYFKVVSKPSTIKDKQVNISVTLVRPEGVDYIAKRIII